MRITSVRVNKNCETRDAICRDGAKLLAFVSIVLDNQMVISHIRIVESTEGRRMISMPSRPTIEGKYRDVAYPLTEELRADIKNEVLDAFKKA